MNTYLPPVNTLLNLGEPDDPWPDYANECGLSPADIPELIRLVKDRDLRWQPAPENEEAEDEITDWYAQIHAWRALAQLGVVEAIPDLIGLLGDIDEYDDDWWGEEAENVFAMLGPAAVEPLLDYLRDDSRTEYGRVTANEALRAIARRHPAERSGCIQGLAEFLAQYDQNDESINAFVISSLSSLKAVEHISLIEAAYQAERVDETIMGDFEDVQVEMGLLEERKTPARHSLSRYMPLLSEGGGASFTANKPRQEMDKKKKAKRKQEKLSRKKNRKKKK